MAQADEVTSVVLANGGWPAAYSWQGRRYRVRALHSVRTVRGERRYRVLTAAGPFELGLEGASGKWRVRGGPRWFQRLWCAARFAPRYPVAPGSARRVAYEVTGQKRERGCAATGVRYADGFAVVR